MLLHQTSCRSSIPPGGVLQCTGPGPCRLPSALRTCGIAWTSSPLLIAAASAAALGPLWLAFAAPCCSCTDQDVCEAESSQAMLWCGPGARQQVLMHLQQRPGMCSQATASIAASHSTSQMIKEMVSWHGMRKYYTKLEVPAGWLTAWAHHHVHLG